MISGGCHGGGDGGGFSEEGRTADNNDDKDYKMILYILEYKNLL